MRSTDISFPQIHAPHDACLNVVSVSGAAPTRLKYRPRSARAHTQNGGCFMRIRVSFDRRCGDPGPRREGEGFRRRRRGGHPSRPNTLGSSNRSTGRSRKHAHPSSPRPSPKRRACASRTAVLLLKCGGAVAPSARASRLVAPGALLLRCAFPSSLSVATTALGSGSEPGRTVCRCPAAMVNLSLVLLRLWVNVVVVSCSCPPWSVIALDRLITGGGPIPSTCKGGGGGMQLSGDGRWGEGGGYT